jgi:hypothetical protein
MDAKRTNRSGRRGKCPQNVPRVKGVKSALKKHMAENPEITHAIEAMHRSQLVQEARVRHLLKRTPYYIKRSNA